MTAVRYEDLPLSVRAKVLAADAKATAGTSGRRKERRAHYPWRCKGCGEVFTQWAPAARHSSAGCGGRYRLDLVLDRKEA
jgi:rRNA maturation endonuclease Nob1